MPHNFHAEDITSCSGDSRSGHPRAHNVKSIKKGGFNMNIETAHRNVSSREQHMNPDQEYETTDELNNTKFREESCLSQH